MGVSFRYPSTWTAHRYVAVSSFSTSIVYLSNDRLHPPCRTTRGQGSVSTACGSPLAHLGPSGVLVEWSEHGFPDWSLKTRAEGKPITVGGHRAKIQIPSSLSPCPDGFDQSMTVVVESVPDNWWQIDACIRGPGVAASLSQVRAMLRSAHLPTE